MDTIVLDKLHEEGLISDASFTKLKGKQGDTLLSVHWEIKMLLYLGILLLTTGISILVYKNIDSIGHTVILMFIALVCTGCFYYCFKHKSPFSTAKVAAPNSFFDYILVLACCTLVTFIGYLQFQYNLFGSNYGLAVFIPMVLLFFCAYYFDHLGVLSMAIINLAAWVQVSITPISLLETNDFNSPQVIITGIALGILLIIAARATKKMKVKEHFEFCYANFGTNVLFVFLLAALFLFEQFYLPWFGAILVVAFFLYRKASLDKSFYFVLIITGYTYIGTSYVVLKWLEQLTGFSEASLYAGFFYFIISAIAVAMFLIRSNKKLKRHDIV